MKLSLDLPSGKALVADVDEPQERCGRQLLGQLALRAATLQAGESAGVDIEWATLRLRADSHTVVVEEPDYLHDPARFVAFLALTSRIFAEQRRLLKTLDVKGQPVAARQYVRVSNDAMRAISVVGRRLSESEPGFSGWQIVSAALSGNETHGLYTMRELAGEHLAWLTAMILPTGWAFRFVGNTLIDCVSPAGDTYELMFSIDL